MQFETLFFVYTCMEYTQSNVTWLRFTDTYFYYFNKLSYHIMHSLVTSYCLQRTSTTVKRGRIQMIDYNSDGSLTSVEPKEKLQLS